MDNVPEYKNALGDSFLNRCYKNLKIFSFFEGSYTAVLGWSEPYTLIVLIIIILIVLPSIFRYSSKSSFLKISRLYNSIRLGLMSLLHQVGYSYTIMIPLETIIGSPVPCTRMEYGSDISDESTSFCSCIFSSSIFIFQIS